MNEARFSSCILLSRLLIYFIVTSFMIALTLQVSIRCEEDGIALQREGTHFFASPPESNVS